MSIHDVLRAYREGTPPAIVWHDANVCKSEIEECLNDLRSSIAVNELYNRRQDLMHTHVQCMILHDDLKDADEEQRRHMLSGSHALNRFGLAALNKALETLYSPDGETYYIDDQEFQYVSAVVGSIAVRMVQNYADEFERYQTSNSISDIAWVSGATSDDLEAIGRALKTSATNDVMTGPVGAWLLKCAKLAFFTEPEKHTFEFYKKCIHLHYPQLTDNDVRLLMALCARRRGNYARKNSYVPRYSIKTEAISKSAVPAIEWDENVTGYFDPANPEDVLWLVLSMQ